MLWRLGILCGIFIACGCGEDLGKAEEGLAPGASDGHQHLLEVDWMPFSEAQIYEASVAVVRGRVVEQRYGFHRTYPFDPDRGRELTPEEAGDEFAELPLTTSRVAIDERYSDAQGAMESSIDIVQLGGRYADGCWVEPNEQPLLRVGDELVAFLKPTGMLPIGAADRGYAIVGGQQGMVPVRGAVLDPLADTVFTRYAGRPVAELARDFQGFAKAPSQGGR